MRNFIPYLVILILFTSSCSKEKDEESCIYEIPGSTIDTSLFISFELNGESLKFCQHHIGPFYWFYLKDTIIDTSVYSYISFYKFCYADPDSFYYYNPPPINFQFLEYSLTKEVKDIVFLSKRIRTEQNFISPLHNNTFTLNDTIFLQGISMLYYNYSTRAVMEYYNYNIDSISNFFNDKSYFIIKSMNKVCHDYYLIEGEFSTRLMTDSPLYEIGEIENGEFRFLIY